MRWKYALLTLALGIVSMFSSQPAEPIRPTYCPAPASPSGWSSGGEIGKNPPQNGVRLERIRAYDRELPWCDRARDPKCSNRPAD